MNVAAKAASLLAKTEAELRALLAEAAEAGEYEAIVDVAAWASAVAQLAAKAGWRGDSTNVESPTRNSGSNSNGSARKSTTKASAAKQTSGGGDKPAYPLFLREGDQLVKVGWSRRL